MAINVGFVGLSASGWAATILGPTLTQNPAYKLVAVSTSSAASASASAEKWGAAKAYHGSTSQIAQDPDVDLVAVAVKTPLHKELVTPAIEAGKDFFVEWPAGAGLEQTKEIARLAREKGVKSMVGLQGRHSVVVKKVKELIDSGRIGKVLSTSLIALSPREAGIWSPLVSENSKYTIDPKNGATFLDIVIGHSLDTFIAVLGDFTSVTATTATIFPTATVAGTGEEIANPAPDQVAFSGILKDSGAIAGVTWRSGYASTPGRQQFIWEIDGTEGSIRIQGDSSFVHIQDPKVYLNGELVDVGPGGLGANVSSGWDEFVKGEKGTHARIEDAVRLKVLIDAIRKSGAEGVRVEV